MRMIATVIVLAGLAVGAVAPGTADAQTDPENIAMYYIVSVTPGSAGQFESAFKGYVEWRKAHGDPWTWSTFIAANGDRLGQYLIFSGGHQWADLDAYADQDPDPDGSQFNAQAGQHTTAVVNRISQANASISHMPEDLSEYQLYRVTSYELRNAGMFMATAGKFHAAAQQASWPGHYGFSTVIGGPPAVTIVVPARTWAEFKPPEQTIPELLVEVYGEDAAAELSERFAHSWRSANTTIWQYRADLSLLQSP